MHTEPEVWYSFPYWIFYSLHYWYFLWDSAHIFVLSYSLCVFSEGLIRLDAQEKLGSCYLLVCWVVSAAFLLLPGRAT